MSRWTAWQSPPRSSRDNPYNRPRRTNSHLGGDAMKTYLGVAAATVLAGWLLTDVSLHATGGEKGKQKDIFNIEAQRAAGKDVKKIVFVGDKRPHGPRGNHEFVAGPMYMARVLNAAYP